MSNSKILLLSSGENKYSSFFSPAMVQCSCVQCLGAVLTGDEEVEGEVRCRQGTMYRVLCLQCAVLIDGVCCTLHTVHSVFLTGGGELEMIVCNALVYSTMCTIQYFQ